MNYFDRQEIFKKVLRIQLQKEEIRNSIRLKDDSIKNKKKNENENENIKDGNIFETSNDNVFEEIVNRLWSYSFVSLEKNKTLFEMYELI